MTLPTVIITAERNQNLRVFHRVLDRRRTAIVHPVRGLICLPKGGCHLYVEGGVRVCAESILQSLVRGRGFCFLSLHEVEEDDTVVCVGSEAGVFGCIWN